MSLAVLPNFPFKDQLTEKTEDGYPPENARFDCVATSFAAAIQYYDGGYVSGDELKDAEYGQSYKDAGTALRRYVDDATDLARSKYHVTAVPYSNTNTIWLVGRIHTWLKQGYPVIATIPSQWGNSYPMATLAHPPFSTHVIVFYGEIDGGLEAMNPWKSYHHSGSDAYWQGRLCEGQIWAVVKEKDVPTAVTGVPSGWTDDGVTLKSPAGVPVTQGFRDKVLAWPGGWAANNTPLAAERVVTSGSIEWGNSHVGPGSRQDFRFCSLGWTQAWGVYVIAVGQDIVALLAQVAALQQQLANAPKPDPVAQTALHALQEVKAALGELR